MAEKLVVLLVGPQGAGKTTWCAEHAADHFRISQDEQGAAEHLRIFENAVLKGESRIVVDRTNASRLQRSRYLAFARQHGYHTRILWFNVPQAECVRRCRQRTGHPTLAPDRAEAVVAKCFKNFQYPTRAEADELIFIGEPPEFAPVVDLRDAIGDRRHLIVGDVHGCFDELTALLDRLRFDPESDVLISVGDVVDRGPKVRQAVEYVRRLPRFYMTMGNHEEKLMRYLKGNPVKVGAGLESTIESFSDGFPPDFADWLAGLPRILRIPSGYVVHAGFNPESPPEEQRAEDCIYMRYFGGKTYMDEIGGALWYALWPASAPRVFFGHIPTERGPETHNVVGLDGGCAVGGELRVFDSADGRVHRLKSFGEYVKPSKPLQSFGEAGDDEIRRRDEYVALGLLRSDQTDDGELAIYTYTDACVYANAWDDVTRNSRGHIFNRKTGECVAYPFPKFFNLGENLESLPERFPWDADYEIMEKLDGWLGVLYRHQGRFKIATRGSFHSSGSEWATQEIQKYDLSCLPDEATLCFEILTPEQRIILDYGDNRRLVILGAFNRKTREEYPRSILVEWAATTGLDLVPVHPPMPLEELKRRKRELEQVEGFVVRFPDGRRVKIKTDWYLDLARQMANLSPISVWEAMDGGRVSRQFLERIPEELRELADHYARTLEGQFEEVRWRIEQTVRPVLERIGNDRPALGRYMQAHRRRLGIAAAAMFLLFDDKREKFDALIKELIYPRANQYVRMEELFPREDGGDI